jgi:hypothetical protein
LELSVNHVQDAFKILIDLIVPESKNFESLPREVRVAHSVSRRVFILVMLSAIDFDNQPMAQTGEVDNVVVSRRLSAKMITA